MIAVIVGTRPEIIKMAPVMRKLKQENLPFVFLHTNQHYSKEMDADIIEDLRLDSADRNFNIGSHPHAAQTGRAMECIEKYFLDTRPSFVLVHGDTNTTLAGTMAAKKMNIPVGHIEAGLRSFDTKMPEEINRMLVDRVSDLHFAPTEIAKENLFADGHTDESIVVCGNTVVDALYDHIQLADESDVLSRFSIEKDSYILATAHRPENVDSEDNLKALLHLLAHASKKLKKEVLLPLHPRTRKNLEVFELALPDLVRVVDPVGYLDMLALIKNASLVMTDSGGIQEEAYILQKPLVTLRTSTERPETLTANFIIDTSIEKFDAAWDAFKNNEVYWENAFGDGSTSSDIVEHVKKYIGHG